MDKRKKEYQSSTDQHSKKLRLDCDDGPHHANERKTQHTIPAMFSSQRPVQKVSCPVCAAKLSISMINTHLDTQCLAVVCDDDEDDDTFDTAQSSANNNKGNNSRLNNSKSPDKNNSTNSNIEQSLDQSTNDIELKSNKITISYPDNQKPFFKIECEINSDHEKLSMEELTTSKYFGVKMTSVTKTSTTDLSLSKRLCNIIPQEKKSKNESNSLDKNSLQHSTSRDETVNILGQPQVNPSYNTHMKSETVISKERQDNISPPKSKKSTDQCLPPVSQSKENSNKTYNTGHVTSSPGRFLKISPAKPAKVKVFSNPLPSPSRPLKHRSQDGISQSGDKDLKSTARSKVVKSLFLQENEPSTSRQLEPICENYSQKNQTNNIQSCTKEEQHRNFKSISHAIGHTRISPAKPAKVKVYSNPLSSPPKKSSDQNNCSRNEVDDVNSSQIDIASQEIIASSEPGYSDLLEPLSSQESLYWTPSSTSGFEDENSDYSQQPDSCYPLTNSQSSGSSGMADYENQHLTDKAVYTTPKKDHTVGNEKSPHRHKSFTSPTKKGTPGKKSQYKRAVPYYLANFKLILDTVLDNADDRSLFSETDLAVFEVFKTISEPSQELYVRLYQRQHTWKKVAKLEYPLIASDLRPAIAELIKAGFFLNENDLKEPEDILNLLELSEMKELAKSFKITCTTQTLSNLKHALLNHGRKQKSVFGKELMTKICQRAKKEFIKACVKLSPEPKTLFSRIMLLFSITSSHEEEDRTTNKQTPLQTLLMADMGCMKFAKYKVDRPHKVFHSKEELIRYETAYKYESDIIATMEKKNYELSFRLFEKADEERKTSIRNEENSVKRDKSLPAFLRRHTALWVYTRIIYLGVEILQKRSCYNEAVELLRKLLNQTVYCQDHRGCWWDRLALNLGFHLREPREAFNAIREGLADKKVKPAHSLALQKRAEKMCGSSSGYFLRSKMDSLVLTQYQDAPDVTIMGRILPNAQKGRNNVFVRSVTEDNGDIIDVISSVEEIALEHYRKCGYNEGIHAEGSSLCTLIFILFWDIVFAEGIPDVFRNHFQAAPLDLRTQDFYLSRQKAIDTHLQRIKQANTDTLLDMLQEKWEEVYGEMCAGVNWKTFSDLNHAKSLLVCFGGNFLSKVAERVLKDHEHFRAGMPDLTVWNTNNNTFKLVEVKGPGDHLSNKQIIWLDFFIKHGVQAEVCYVKAFTQKRQRLRAMIEQSEETED